MTMYYVATRACYVLVDANSEEEARTLGRAALADLYADLSQQLTRDTPINIHTLREASADEVELWRWHHDRLTREMHE